MASSLPRRPADPARSWRRAAGAVLSALVSSAAVLAAAPAQAEDGFRYWNYFQVEDDAFAFAQTGPADTTPEDGDVEGWRYGTSTEAVGIEPRADPAQLGFDTVCEGTEAGTGEKRVAILVDYGTDADAEGAEVPEPTAYCAVAPTDASGLQVLESVVDVRTEDGGICALEGYPASGCFATVKDAQVESDEPNVDFALPAAATEDAGQGAAAGDTGDTAEAAEAAEESQGGISWPLVAVIGLVVVLAAVAVPLFRRNRES